MSPVSTFSMLLKVNPSAAKFILGGLGGLAAGVIFLAWKSDPTDAAVAGAIVLGFALMVSLMLFISKNNRMRTVLSWTVVGAFVLSVGLLFESVLQLTGAVPSLPCLVRALKVPPQVCERQFSKDVETFGPAAQSGIFIEEGPERIWLAQVVVPAPESAPADFTVYMQFVDPSDRNQMVDFGADITGEGWLVEGADMGGELVSAGPERNEVRYFHDEDKAGAIALARAFFERNPEQTIHVRDFSRLGTYSPIGQLEIWVDEIDN